MDNGVAPLMASILMKIHQIAYACRILTQKFHLHTHRETDTQTQTHRQLHSLHVGWRIFFPVVLLCQILVLAGNRFWFYILMYLEYNTVVVLYQFFGSGGNSFWCYILTQCTIQLCSCASFLVVVGNSSQNENTFLQKDLIGLLYYDPLADVSIS